ADRVGQHAESAPGEGIGERLTDEPGRGLAIRFEPGRRVGGTHGEQSNVERESYKKGNGEHGTRGNDHRGSSCWSQGYLNQPHDFLAMFSGGPALAISHNDMPHRAALKTRRGRDGYQTMVRVCICSILLMMSGSLGARERLALRVSPAVSFAPANL